jgi:23S rRNA (cytosine1962-C5)-methyltransferase
MSSANEYVLLDSGDFQKLERVGSYTLVRPALQALWKPRLPQSEWKRADAVFVRDESGKGQWRFKGAKLPEQWIAKVETLSFIVRLTDFGHIGFFPEHFQELPLLQKSIMNTKAKPFRCLNLFAHTGGLTLQLAKSGSHLVHLDASKKSVDWARDNAKAAGLESAPVRWIVDDVRKFVSKEIRRGAKYDGIILDPPSFGRGAKKEVWKIEDDLGSLLSDLEKLHSENFSFLFLTCHTPGITGLAMQNLLGSTRYGKGHYIYGELAVSEEKSTRKLPSGSFCLWIQERN